MLKISHRGNPGLENTLLSFKNNFVFCTNNNIPHCLELDLHITSDKEIVVIHDSKLNRTTTGSGYVQDNRYNVIKRLKIRKNNIIHDETIPSFYEFLTWLNFIEKTNDYTSFIILDIKLSDNLELIKRVLTMIKNFRFEKTKFIIGVWSTTHIDYIKQNSDFELMFIVDNYSKLKYIVHLNQIDILSLNINIFKNFITFIKTNKLIYTWKTIKPNRKIITWVINNKFEYYLSKIIKSYAIISDLILT